MAVKTSVTVSKRQAIGAVQAEHNRCE